METDGLNSLYCLSLRPLVGPTAVHKPNLDGVETFCLFPLTSTIFWPYDNEPTPQVRCTRNYLFCSPGGSNHTLVTIAKQQVRNNPAGSFLPCFPAETSRRRFMIIRVYSDLTSQRSNLESSFHHSRHIQTAVTDPWQQYLLKARPSKT